MSDRPEDRAEDRRRRGPLGDEGDAEETRRVPRGGGPGGDDEATRQGSPESTEARASRSEEDTASRRAPDEGPETRAMRSSDTREDEMLPYTREERLRDVYGGVDWLASFIGCIFALLCGGALVLLLSGLVLGPLGFRFDLQGREINAAFVTGLVVVGLVLFLAYFVGGYVAGRLVRFDGGRNGAATVVWGLLLGAIFGLFGFLLAGFLPGSLFELLQGFRGGALSALNDLWGLGIVGVGIVVGALLLELLGGFLGGRLGNLYHTRVDRTT